MLRRSCTILLRALVIRQITKAQQWPVLLCISDVTNLLIRNELSFVRVGCENSWWVAGQIRVRSVKSAEPGHSVTKLRYYGPYLIREHALTSIRIYCGDDVIVGVSALNRGVHIVCAGIEGRVYLGIRSTRDSSAIHVIAHHIARGACIPVQSDAVW